MAMRRVVVTPTFAAGLGVVIAAGMALPMTRTVISYGGEPPAGGHPCPVKDCENGSSGDSGTLAGANPGLPLVTPSPVTHSPDQAVAPSPSGTGAAGGSKRSTAGPQPVMQSQTLRQWQSGFIEQITITDPGESAPANWQLRLTYDGAHIIGVWGGQWSLSGDNTVVVTPSAGDGNTGSGGGQGGSGFAGGSGTGSTGGSGTGSAGGSGTGGGAADGRGGASGGGGSGSGGTWNGNLQVVLAVSGGHAGPPSGCSFNGRTCRSR
jgi:Cellulose binding domain